MTDWGWWIIAAVILGTGEVTSGGAFFLAPFAVGAIAATIGALVGIAGGIQVAIFLAVSAVTFGLVRPIAKRHLTMPPQLRTGTAALVGKQATVLQQIDRHSGSIRLEGEVWSARPYLDDDVIEEGKQVQVMQIKGATALVSE